MTRKPALTQEVKRGSRKFELEADKSSFAFSLRQAVGHSQLVCRIVSPIVFSTVCPIVYFIVCSSGDTQTRSNVFMSKLCDVRSQYFTQQLREVEYIIQNTLFITVSTHA